MQPFFEKQFFLHCLAHCVLGDLEENNLLLINQHIARNICIFLPVPDSLPTHGMTDFMTGQIVNVVLPGECFYLPLSVCFLGIYV